MSRTSASARPAAPQVPHPGTPARVDGAQAVLAAVAAAGTALDLDPAAGVVPPEGVMLLGRRSGAAAGAAASGASLSGLRAAHFARGEGVGALRASLAAAAGRRLPWVLHAACRATTRHARALGPGHDDLHALADTGAFLFVARDVQQVLDLGLVAQRLAELALVPGVVAQDDPLLTRALEEARLPTPALARELLGRPDDALDTPTAAQRLVWGARRRVVPAAFDVDAPAAIGGPAGPEAWAQGAAAQQPFFGEPLAGLAERALAEFAALSGRRHDVVSAHRVEDAEYVLVAQGGAVPLCEAVADRLRAERGLRVGVAGVVLLQPFPAQRLSALLRGKRAVAVLERTLSPLAAEPPLARELRAVLLQALENERAAGDPPHPEVAACSAAHLPQLYSVTYGLGGAPLRTGQVVAAVENLLPRGAGRRRVVAGVDFARPDTRIPKLQIRQEQVLEACPELAALALPPASDVDPLPRGALSLRVLGLGRAGTPDPARALGLALAGLTGLHLRAWPDAAPVRLGLPAGGRCVLSPVPVAWPGDRPRLDALLVQEPGALRRAHEVVKLEPGGLLLVQTDLSPEALWATLRRDVQHAVRERALRLACVPVPPDDDGPARGQAALQALAGALVEALGLKTAAALPPAAAHGAHALRVEQAAALSESGPATGEAPRQPAALRAPDAPEGPAHPGHFWEQVGALHATGQPALADPRAATGAVPAASSTLRDLGSVRTLVPRLVPERCTACGDCWTQCPDSALRARIAGVDALLEAAEAAASGDRGLPRLQRVRKPLAQLARRRLLEQPGASLSDVLPAAFADVAGRLDLGPEKRAALDAEFARAAETLAAVPLVRARAFLEDADARAPGLGGLLALTVDPQACKGCEACVQACPERALESVPQDDVALETLAAHDALHARLPDTDERHLDGTLPRLLLRRAVAGALRGGHGACAGCGETAGLRLVLAAAHAQRLPRLAAHLQALDGLIEGLETKARGLVAGDADLAAAAAPGGALDVHVDGEHGATVRRLARQAHELRGLRERLARDRSAVGAAAAGGCASAACGTWPCNAATFPLAHSLLADAPALAAGLWEGHAQRLTREAALVRRARLELEDAFDPAVHGPQLERLTWRDLDDDELALVPPLLVLGGDGALAGAGLAELSALLADDRPVKVLLLDNQLGAETGGVPGATAFPGQRGAAGRARLEPALLGLAHREAFVLQSSPAAPAHLLGGLLRGLASRRPALFVLYAACPLEHGHAPRDAALAARLALDSRAFPLLLHDPDAPGAAGGAPDLSGNPEPAARRVRRELVTRDTQGRESRRAVPVTVADWAVVDGRFAAQLQPLSDESGALPLHELLDLPRDARADRRAFVEAPDGRGGLRRLEVGPALVALADERDAFWSRLRRLAGDELPPAARERVQSELAQGLRRRTAELQAEHEARVTDLKRRLPALVARRMAEGLLRDGNASRTVAELLEAARRAPQLPALPALPARAASPAAEPAAPAATPSPAPAAAAVALAPPAAPATPPADLELEPSIDSARCTACNECTNINKRMFAYNAKKQAFIKDAAAGTFAQLVAAAEKCPVRIIHPGTPRNPAEKNLEELRRRAAPFNA